ncbi:MAG: hypothetical protein K2X66_14720, partial [Cyanobacteria bacterium]|nr:hypothetical protein [Cyanobacteriota bacterium]
QPEAKAEDLENIPDISPEIVVNHQEQESGQKSHQASPLDHPDPDPLKPSVSLDDEDDLTLEMQAPKAQESHVKTESTAPVPLEVPSLEEPLGDEEPLQDTIPIYKVLDVEKQQRTSQVGYQEGDKIRHDKYGVGVVNKVIPMDEHIVLNITFESVGKRLLDPNLSKIDKI